MVFGRFFHLVGTAGKVNNHVNTGQSRTPVSVAVNSRNRHKFDPVTFKFAAAGTNDFVTPFNKKRGDRMGNETIDSGQQNAGARIFHIAELSAQIRNHFTRHCKNALNGRKNAGVT